MRGMLRGGVCLLVLMGLGVAARATDTGNVAGTGTATSLPASATKPFHIEFRNAPLKDALRFLARIVNMNLVIPEDTDGAVSVTLEQTSVIDAVNAIAKSNGLDYAVERGILRVGKTEQFTTNGEDLKTEIIRLKYALATAMLDKIKGLMTTRGSVLADERTNSLVVRDTLANLENVRRFIDSVDIRDAQVLIEGKIVEATRDFTRNLGIQWGITTINNPRGNVQGVSSVGTSDGGRRLNVDLPASPAPDGGIGLLVGQLAGGLNIDVAITGAENRGDLHVISEPSIVTSNGVAAHIRSGETIYVKTAGAVSIGGTSASGGDTGLQSISTGVELKVTPQISVGNYVKMQIEAVTSSPDFTRTVDGIPAVIENIAKTTVLVQDNEMTVIGGLIKFRGQESKRKVPFLGDIPLLGYIFQSRSKSRTNNDLLLFIRPRVVQEYIPSSLQDELPHIANVKRDITVEDQSHLPRKARKGEEYRSGRARQDRYRSRYENYRESHGQ